MSLYSITFWLLGLMWFTAIPQANAVDTPTPRITANGSHDPITVQTTTPINISVNLDPGKAAGQDADWWVVAHGSSLGWYSWVYPNGWVPGIAVAAESPLFSLSQFNVFSGYLPSDQYTIYFGVDMSPDKIINEPLFYDYVQVAVNPAPPTVTLDPPAVGASYLSGHAYNIDPSKIKVVIYVLTNQWYVQPFIDAPFTDISADGSWSSYTHPWNSIVVLLVDPANYTPAPTKITNPALDPGVLAWTEYPSTGPIRLDFSGRSWGIKVSGDPFDPGPNLWSNDSSAVNVAADGRLHLKIAMIDGKWRCGEVYLLESLGYGTYTVQVSSHLDQLDLNTVAAPLFIYAAPDQELDNEYSGAGGLIPSPNNAQFVVQPYNVSGNNVRYIQPSTAQFTSQMEWRADHVTFRTWNGWSTVPAAGDIIQEWTYTGAYIPPPGQERVHINLWLLNGSAPVSGVGDEMVISSFTYFGSE